MASPQNGTDQISTDHLNAITGLNGGPPDVVGEKVMLVKIGTGEDGFFHTAGDVDSGGFHCIAVAQSATNYAVSTVNSSAAQLAAGATFTGGIETAFNQQSYSILMVSDQAMTVTLFDYIDAAGTQLGGSTVFAVLAGAGLRRSGVVNGNYFKVTVLNSGGGITTTFKLDVAYGTIPSSTQLNNNPSAIMEINGTAVDVGSGFAGPGTQRVAVATAKPLFRGRASSYRTLGRAGTTGQKIFALFNAAGSSVTVVVTKTYCDLSMSVLKLITVHPPVIRLWKITAVPTNGSAANKLKIGGSSTSSASVTAWQDSSADVTGSATTLTATLPAGEILDQEFAARLITGAGYEPPGTVELAYDSEITLAAGEGVVVYLDYNLATMNPITDIWLAGIEWSET